MDDYRVTRSHTVGPYRASAAGLASGLAKAFNAALAPLRALEGAFNEVAWSAMSMATVMTTVVDMDEVLAFEAFVEDGGQPDLIYLIEDWLEVDHG